MASLIVLLLVVFGLYKLRQAAGRAIQFGAEHPEMLSTGWRLFRLFRR